MCMQIFGDSNSFAIQYRPEADRYAYLHLILGNKFIGAKDEYSLIGTWVLMMKHLKESIQKNWVNLEHPIFKSLSDKEIFELVSKANQLEDEFNPLYEYLPHFESEFWGRHFVSLDETIDAYLIVVIRKGVNLKYIWEGWRSPCPPEQINKTYSVEVPLNFFNSTVDDCLSFIEKTYPELWKSFSWT
jgi:hypothetical protein